MFIAHELGKTEREVRLMTVQEFARWRAYFKILKELEKNPPRGR